jgi:hypothetical protein
VPKFFDNELATGAETFEVVWSPPPAGLEAGAVVLFEYRHRDDEQVRRLTRKYAFPVEGERKATFVVKSADAPGAGPVGMWRVRLVYKGQVLAESTTANWE